MDELAGQRAAAYWFSDGLPELLFGAALTACGATGLVWTVYLPYPWMRACFFLTLLAFAALFIWDRKILNALKTRLTYPRTGYVQPPKEGPAESGDHILTLHLATAAPPKQKNAMAFREGTVYLLFIGYSWVGAFEDRWGIAIAMFVLACLIYTAHKWSAWPYSWWSVLPLALSGIPLSILALPVRSQRCIPMLAGGLWLLSRGAWTMAHYLKNNRLPQTSEGSSI